MPSTIFVTPTAQPQSFKRVRLSLLFLLFMLLQLHVALQLFIQVLHHL